MNCLLAANIPPRLLATLLAVEESPSAPRADTRHMVAWLLVAGAVIAVVSVILVIANRMAWHWRHKSHRGLFSGLCKMHNLDSSSRRLLNRVVRFHRLAQPGRLFIEPKWLDPAGLGPAFRADAVPLAKLRTSLFNLRPKGDDKS